ncbi:MAG: coenzyme F420-0:L-glutamate ligase [Candidatus Peregrinibacteria bacterium]
MQILPVTTGLLRFGTDFADHILKHASLKTGDIVVVSSKVIATLEGAAIDLKKITPTAEAKIWAKRCGRTAEFRQAILDETARMHGRITGDCPLAMLTELQPDGLRHGTILTANAGLDLSNTEESTAIGWPHDPVRSAHDLRTKLEAKSGARIAVIVTDSCCRPRRIGVTAFALATCGIAPFEDLRGIRDLFGHPLTMTREARADQLATASNMIMGNAGQGIPAAVIREHGFVLDESEGWVEGISPEEDLFRGTV